nr:hypothetical protein B296_00035408 [Ipomoea batatas]
MNGQIVGKDKKTKKKPTRVARFWCILVEAAAAGEDDESHLCITKNRQLIGLLQQPISALAEGDLPLASPPGSSKPKQISSSPFKGIEGNGGKKLKFLAFANALYFAANLNRRDAEMEGSFYKGCYL